jgi:hypothetical protein
MEDSKYVTSLQQSSSAVTRANIAALLERIESHYGEGCMISENSCYPKNSTSDLWHIFYDFPGKPRREFYFEKIDHGVCFSDRRRPENSFFPRSLIDDDSLRCCQEALETNRCFFIHLGVAMSIHPFALASAFRVIAEQAVSDKSIDDMYREDLWSAISRGDFVDFNILSAIWPVEFENVRILLIDLTPEGRFQPGLTGVTLMRSPDDMRYDSKAPYQDVILTRQAGHFTLLLPSDDNAAFKKNPIDTMLREAKVYQIQVYDIPSGQLKRFCISEALAELRRPSKSFVQSPTMKVSAVVPETYFGRNEEASCADMPQPNTTLVTVGATNKGLFSSACTGSFNALCNVQ